MPSPDAIEPLKISLILPTMNEIDGMRAILPQIDRALFHEIIVTDGGSHDGTVEYARAQNLTVIRQPGIGQPNALEEACRVYTGDVYLSFTPDGNSLPELLGPTIAKLKEGYDMVVVSRYLHGARSHDDDLMTGLGNGLYRVLVNVLFHGRYTDVLVGYRAIRRAALDKMRLLHQPQECRLRAWFWRMNSWDLGSSIRAARAGLKTAEIPGDEPKRIGGVRKLSIVKNGLGALLQVIWDYFTFWPK